LFLKIIKKEKKMIPKSRIPALGQLKCPNFIKKVFVFCLLISAFGIYLSTLPAAASIVVNDDFNDNLLDSAWSINFDNATWWTYIESGTTLRVTDIATTGAGWTSVNLTQYFTPLSDFNIDFDFSWDSEEDNGAMQNVLVQAYDQNGSKIAEAGYSDGWFVSGGAQYGMIGGSIVDTGPDSMPYSGSASININRTADAIEILWDGASLLSGTEGALLDRVDLVFSYYVYNESGLTSFGNETVDLIKVEGTSAPVPVPATMLLLGSGLIGLAGFRRKNKKHNM
jgi:hypothetical protein